MPNDQDVLTRSSALSWADLKAMSEAAMAQSRRLMAASRVLIDDTKRWLPTYRGPLQKYSVACPTAVVFMRGVTQSRLRPPRPSYVI